VSVGQVRKGARILVACEESQAVTVALRARGAEAFSCDLLPCSGGHPEWHIQADAVGLIDRKWDMILAFPPCTHLASSGARHFARKRADGSQQRGIEFFMAFANADCERVAIENPVGIMSTVWRKPDQIIQPWMFGHPETKATCLWLRGLPRLEGTDDVSDAMRKLDPRLTQRVWRMSETKDRAKLRSKTYPGVAAAMASQWYP